MKPPWRVITCLECKTKVTICRYCDHGNSYCGQECAQIARKRSQQQSAIRYQKTLKCKFSHAKRQKKYRLKKMEPLANASNDRLVAQKKIVTHQGSKAIEITRNCCLIAFVTIQHEETSSQAARTCHFCHKSILQSQKANNEASLPSKKERKSLIGSKGS